LYNYCNNGKEYTSIKPAKQEERQETDERDENRQLSIGRKEVTGNLTNRGRTQSHPVRPETT